MAEQTKTRENVRKLSQQEFYKLCQWVGARPSPILESSVDLAEMAKKDLKFDVAPISVRTAIKVTGVSHTPKRGGYSRAFKGNKRDKSRTVAGALLCVMKDLETTFGQRIFRDGLREHLRDIAGGVARPNVTPLPLNGRPTEEQLGGDTSDIEFDE